MEYIDSLPDDIVKYVALFFSLDSLNSFMLISSKINGKITDDFWALRFSRDFGSTDRNGDWRDLYKYYLYSFTLWACGSNIYGELGLGDFEPHILPTQISNLFVKAVSTCADSTAVIDADNNIWTFGNGAYGILGVGNKMDKNIPTKIPNIKAKQISVGQMNMAVIDLDNSIWVCGDNSCYQLGLDCAGLNFLEILVKIPNVKAKQVCCAKNFIIFIDLNDDVWGCGLHEPYKQQSANYSDKCNNYGRFPTQVSNLKAKQISAGDHHVILIDLDNNVWAWGENKYGQLGVGDRSDRIQPTQLPIKAKEVIADHADTAIIDLDSNVWVCGSLGLTYLWGSENILFPKQIPNIKAKCFSGHIAVVDLDNNIHVLDTSKLQLIKLDNVNRIYPESDYVIMMVKHSKKIADFSFELALE